MPTAKTQVKTKTNAIYQLKVTLKDSEPPIWRRIQVPADITLERLHHAIQDAMGWEEDHLHHFEIKGAYYSHPGFRLEDARDECRAKLNQLVTRAHTKFTYLYDFGDDWEHVIQLERSLPREVGVKYPHCTDGARGCPPEDCGGIWGYEAKVEAIRDPKHPEHSEIREWLGDFDPEAFDVVKANKRLR